MSRKKKTENYAPVKPMEEMSDTEFITYADYLSSPYYRAYINAKSRVSSDGRGYTIGKPDGASYGQRNANYGNSPDRRYHPFSDNDGNAAYGYSPSTVNGKAAKTKKRTKLYTKKRGICLILILLFMLVVLAVGVLGFIKLDAVNDYTAIYQKTGISKDVKVNIGLVDPIIALVKQITPIDIDSVYHTEYVQNKLDNVGTMEAIARVAVPVAAALILICALIGFLKALVALFAKRKDNGYYKKIRFGFISIVMLLCGLIVAAGGVYLSGMDFSLIADFFTFKSASNSLQAGYALYAIVAIPIITLICSCVSYKKLKR